MEITIFREIKFTIYRYLLNIVKTDFYINTVVALVSSLSAEQSLKNVFKVLGKRLEADGAFINVFDRQKREIVFVAHCDAQGKSKSLSPVYVPPGYAPRRSPGSVIVVGDLSEEPFTRYVLDNRLEDIRSLIMLSLDQDGQHLGVVCFYSRFFEKFTKEDASLLEEFHDVFCLVTSNSLRAILSGNNEALISENLQLKDSEKENRREMISASLSHTPSLTELGRMAEQVSQTDIPVLIQGETGSGKEVFADLIQKLSHRKKAPFIKINCGAIPETLIDAEFFGYEKGAFTDAKQAKAGIFEQADGGTLFLDEVGELTLSAQVRLLRVLQQKIVRRIGSVKDVKVNFRLIAATHRNLEKMASEGTFRTDLLYRLNLFPLYIAPLRERRDDIAPLVKLFLSRLKRKYAVSGEVRIRESSYQNLFQYAWPGNVRELENTLERSFLMARDKSSVEVLPPEASKDEIFSNGVLRESENIAQKSCPDFESLQREYFQKVLKSCAGKISGAGGASEITGLHPNTLRSKLEKLGISFKAVKP